MGGVLSVQQVTLTLAASSATDSTALAVGTVTANCVPFVTKYITTPTSDQYEEYATDIYFTNPGGTPTVTAETSAFATRAMSVEVTVVEFDPSKVNVYPGTFSIADTAYTSTDSIGGTVVEANSFMVHTWQGGRNGWIDDSLVRGRIASPTQVTIDREATRTTNAIDGNFYVVESISGADFTVQTVDLSLTGGSAGPVTSDVTTPVDSASTFIVGSFHSALASDDPNSVPIIEFEDGASANTVTLERQGTSGTYTAHVFVVTFSGSEAVQRGRLTQTASQSTQDVDITAVGDETQSLAWTPATSSLNNSCGTSAGSANNPDAFYALTFVDSNTIRFTHDTTSGETGNWISWEVVEWDVGGGGGASPRRVLVR